MAGLADDYDVIQDAVGAPCPHFALCEYASAQRTCPAQSADTQFEAGRLTALRSGQYGALAVGVARLYRFIFQTTRADGRSTNRCGQMDNIAFLAKRRLGAAEC